MNLSYLKERTGESVNLNQLLLDNSIELNNANDLDSLIDKIGDAKYVLLGEASHGTHEYYTWRTQISKKLIEQKGFSFIAVEGDWPDCYRLNRYIKNYSDAGKTAFEVLHTFRRWPTWMWANWEIVALAEWLHKYNERLSRNQKIGFYGLDVYSLWESLETIIKYLDKKDPKTKHTAVNAMKCFEPYSDGEGQSYARATLIIPSTCEEEVIDLLMQIRKSMSGYNTDPEAVMSAEQNAQVVVNAECYYRAMVRPGPDSWNIRDHHMVDTLERLMKFHGSTAKAIIWEHNTHIGDARATDMVRENTVNVGQLVHEQHEQEGVFAIGFGSYKGTVIAGQEWGDVMRVMNVPEAIPGSWEYLMHQLEPTKISSRTADRIIFMTEEMKEQIGQKELGHRAIGVVYHPQYEHLGNYVPSLMPYRYEAFIYLDETSALHPLHIKPSGHQIPETFPFGL
jgi:erythromycin esterase